MRKIMFLLIAFIGLTHIAMAQDFVRELDKKTDKPLLRGQLTFDDIQNESTCAWLPRGTKSYEPNEDVISKLSSLLPNYKLVAFIGTWCEDTQNLLPAFYKTLLATNFDFNALSMYGVNREKMALNAEHKIYNISRVPTFIIMDRFREVGRITESITYSIEEDLLDLIEADMLAQEANK